MINRLSSPLCHLPKMTLLACLCGQLIIGAVANTGEKGIFAGIGTIFLTLYNGVVIGAVAGHLTGVGYGETFWQFVVGHGSFELTAAVIASMAGIRLGLGLIAPAPYGRKDALVVAGRESIELLCGAALMTFIAAFIEAFWSSSSAVPNMVKYIVGAMLWVLVALYLVLCGRRS